MTKDEALKLALEALEYHTAQTRPIQRTEAVINAIKQALVNDALDKKAENARELGLDYEPDYKVTVVDDQHPNGVPLEQWGRPAPDLQADLVKANAQAEYFEREWYLRGDELDATNRQVEILSDALAESRREVAALKAVQDWKKLPPEEPPLVKWAKEQPAPVQEPKMYEDWYDSSSCGHCGMVNGHRPECRHNYKTPAPAPVQEPAAWGDAKQSELNDWFLSLPAGRQAVLLEDKWMLAGAAFLAGKTTPPAAQRQWVGLTDEEAKKAFAEHNCDISKDLAGILARAIEAKLKEKNQ